MKLWTTLTSAIAGFAALALGVSAFGASAPIINSKHNMNNVFGANTIQDNQICLPCHTAHGRQPNTSTATEYLWNHQMPTTSYTLYGTDTTKYRGLDEASLMCLSCHDGTVAVDSYYSTLGISSPGTTLHVGTHTLGQTSDANGSTAGFVVGGGTGDLTHDHPVGITYPGLSAATGVWNGTGVRFKDPTSFNTSTYRPTNAKDASGNFITGNYVNNAGANITAVGGASISLQKLPGDAYATIVGCVACHTPHTNTYNFLHMPNTNSQLCLTCHDK